MLADTVEKLLVLDTGTKGAHALRERPDAFEPRSSHARRPRGARMRPTGAALLRVFALRRPI
ncbi:MAG TPA: hypothetical protein VGV41_18220 [Pseudolabrys sp.]|uniref:hypothetical protein n=1 Tax=Pseudolabrys sp. TaxID=1960880 RepID=UPI002DDD2A84|nr:hypothetical protein [Pseudolabrys sp.]HEV2630567.1 hypothetical protein [Pseudolabrys sp.]